MSKAKQAILDKINKRSAKIKAKKRNKLKSRGYRSIIADFIKAMEIVKEEATHYMDFDSGLKKEAELMYADMRGLDPEVDISLKWNREDRMATWEDLMIEGVQITWSRWYRGKHPLDPPERYIDIAELFLEGYFDD